jgi:hypothetical protein
LKPKKGETLEVVADCLDELLSRGLLQVQPQRAMEDTIASGCRRTSTTMVGCNGGKVSDREREREREHK